MSKFQQTPDLPGEIQEVGNSHTGGLNFDEAMRVAEEMPEQSPLDSNNPWGSIWLPDVESMGEVDRASEARRLGFSYFLGHNGMVCLITSLYGESLAWMPVIRMEWLKDRELR